MKGESSNPFVRDDQQFGKGGGGGDTWGKGGGGGWQSGWDNSWGGGGQKGQAGPRAAPMRVWERDVLDLRRDQMNEAGVYVPLSKSTNFETVTFATSMIGLKDLLSKEKCMLLFSKSPSDFAEQVGRTEEINELIPSDITDDRWEEWLQRVRAVNNEMGIRVESVESSLSRRRDPRGQGGDHAREPARHLFRDRGDRYDHRDDYPRDRFDPVNAARQAEPEQNTCLMNAQGLVQGCEGKFIQSDVRDDVVWFCFQFSRDSDHENVWLNEHESRAAHAAWRTSTTPQERTRRRTRQRDE